MGGDHHSFEEQVNQIPKRNYACARNEYNYFTRLKVIEL